MKCLNCNKEARWQSSKYKSPLCNECARIEVDMLLSTGKFSYDETAIIDFYEPIMNISINHNVNTHFNPTTGEISYHKKPSKEE